ncbi:hypothetical protein llap_2009 [Limosa lapponica baueri]|uniref:Uncharacterized protein n=1 Tax=Limosa lapponica baueri TaxID=1758121 RepID=A0A2I0UNP7_LIMLA|nr:hypothetical protein llap_2009 [Limosa lapponica baueri]
MIVCSWERVLVNPTQASRSACAIVIITRSLKDFHCRNAIEEEGHRRFGFMVSKNPLELSYASALESDMQITTVLLLSELSVHAALLSLLKDVAKPTTRTSTTDFVNGSKGRLQNVSETRHCGRAITLSLKKA